MGSIELNRLEGDVHGESSGIDGWSLVTEIQNVSSKVTQSINGSCRCNHEYSGTAEAERSNAKKKRVRGRVMETEFRANE